MHVNKIDCTESSNFKQLNKGRQTHTITTQFAIQMMSLKVHTVMPTHKHPCAINDLTDLNSRET